MIFSPNSSPQKPFRPLLSLFLLGLAGGLMGCGVHAPPNQLRFTPPEQPGGRLCLVSCTQAKGFAEERCHYQQRDCTNTMNRQAILDYETYAREQFLTKSPLDLYPRDFERPQKCSPTSCLENVNEAYYDCYESCGGHIELQKMPQ